MEAQQTPVQPESATDEASDVEDVADEPESSESDASDDVSEPGASDAGVRTMSPQGGEVGFHGEGVYEPFLEKSMEFREVPDEGETLTLETPEDRIPATEFLDTLAQATGWNILSSEGVEEEKLRFWVEQVTPQEALEVLRFHGIYYDYDPESRYLYVRTQEEYLRSEHGGMVQQEFEIEHADLSDMEEILSNFLSDSGRMVADPRTGYLLVLDTESNLETMESIISQLDVPITARTYELQYANADDISSSVEEIITERGSVHVDPRSNSIVVTDLRQRQERIAEFIETVDKKLETRTWTLNYADPVEIGDRVGELVPDEMGRVETDEDVYQVTVTATPTRLEEVDGFIEAWDQPRKQVELEAYLVSASSTITRELGVNWQYFGTQSGDPLAIQHGNETPDFQSAPDAGQRFTIGDLPYQVPLRDPLTSQPIRDIAGELVADPQFRGNRLSVVLNYLDQQGEVSILSRPRVTVRDGEEAMFESVEQRPFIEGGFDTGFGRTGTGTGTGSDTGDDRFRRTSNVVPMRAQFIDVGTILRVMPRINEESNIMMDIEVEDSTAETVTVTAGDQSSTIPQKRQNRAETQVMVHDNHTVVIGGLRSAGFDENVDQVPLLGDIPFLGNLFKNTEGEHRETDLLIFITPRIVDEYTRPEASRLADYEAQSDERLREARRPLLQRLLHSISDREIAVSVGETGAMHSAGSRVNVDDLRQAFAAIERPSEHTAYVRAHPNAPAERVNEVSEAAEERGLMVEVDTRGRPFVPIEPTERTEEEPAPEMEPYEVPVEGQSRME
ncbi:MAG: secretin N-terminal domain-containing protein [Candidatus Hydrogenedentota bacterium]